MPPPPRRMPFAATFVCTVPSVPQTIAVTMMTAHPTSASQPFAFVTRMSV